MECGGSRGGFLGGGGGYNQIHVAIVDGRASTLTLRRLVPVVAVALRFLPDIVEIGKVGG